MSSSENPDNPSIGKNDGKQDSRNGFAVLPLKGSRPTNMDQHASWQQPYFMGKSREIKRLSEITSKLMAESRLELKCPDTQPEVFPMIVSFISHSIIQLPIHLPIFPTILPSFFLYPSNHLATYVISPFIHPRMCMRLYEDMRRHLFPFLRVNGRKEVGNREAIDFCWFVLAPT